MERKKIPFSARLLLRPASGTAMKSVVVPITLKPRPNRLRMVLRSPMVMIKIRSIIETLMLKLMEPVRYGIWIRLDRQKETAMFLQMVQVIRLQILPRRSICLISDTMKMHRISIMSLISTRELCTSLMAVVHMDTHTRSKRLEARQKEKQQKMQRRFSPVQIS